MPDDAVGPYPIDGGRCDRARRRRGTIGQANPAGSGERRRADISEVDQSHANIAERNTATKN